MWWQESFSHAPPPLNRKTQNVPRIPLRFPLSFKEESQSEIKHFPTLLDNITFTVFSAGWNIKIQERSFKQLQFHRIKNSTCPVKDSPHCCNPGWHVWALQDPDRNLKLSLVRLSNACLTQNTRLAGGSRRSNRLKDPYLHVFDPCCQDVPFEFYFIKIHVSF